MYEHGGLPQLVICTDRPVYALRSAGEFGALIRNKVKATVQKMIRADEGSTHV